jgi:hypothetical protein
MKEEITKLCIESYDQGVKDVMDLILMTIEALYDSEDPTPMYQTGYNHALDHIKELINARKGKNENLSDSK